MNIDVSDFILFGLTVGCSVIGWLINQVMASIEKLELQADEFENELQLQKLEARDVSNDLKHLTQTVDRLCDKIDKLLDKG
ncbi:hypothetical protein C942_00514 [Photobacterium marinum]|uniref:Uncharacterized protein n=1 Tax=Photobacterium marinum TaxID=1056511 RepID=L8JF74_9GAMM|nr:hypothetical protein [Photobacterium marinum]ELR66072.1 hypothetical protein C942_00514 [Photobacterium marinum]